MGAIDQALRIASWYEHLTSEEVPPEWMWTLEWELEAWFKEVEIARDMKYNGHSSDAEDIGPSVPNEYAERFK